MTKLATGRNEARKILYQDLFFLIDKISEFESPEIAQEEGYAFLFNGEGAPCNVSPEETSPSLSVENSFGREALGLHV